MRKRKANTTTDGTQVPFRNVKVKQKETINDE
jgi:hypothetical protein